MTPNIHSLDAQVRTIEFCRTGRAGAPRTSVRIGNDSADRVATMEEILDCLLLADCRHVGSRPVAACRALGEWTFNESYNRRPTKRSDAVDGSDTRTDHRITSSARICSSRDILSPSCRATRRSITKTYLESCSIGRSEGLAPLRILWMYPAIMRPTSAWFVP